MPIVKNKASSSSIKGFGGTYYAGSGTFISSSGQGMSTRTIPTGAKISFSKAPIFTSGGGAGGGGATSPSTTPAQATAQYAKQIKQLRTEAKARGISAEVLARQRATQRARQLRAIAKQRKMNISTPARQMTFIKKIRREESRKVTPTIKEQRRVQQIAKQRDINIFSMQSWKDLGEALRKSKSQKDRTLGKKILTEPLLFASKFVSRTGEIKELPAGLISLARKPSNIKNILSNLKTDFADTVQLLKTSKSEGFAKIGADIFTFKIIGGTLKATGKVSSNVATRLSPKFVGVAKKGAKLTVNGAGSKRAITIDVVGRIPKESIAKQIKRAGTRVDAISSQADTLVGLIRRGKVIRKPLGNAEKKLTSTGKKLLRKFDRGKITSSELVRLDKAIKKAGAKGILERSFFADPSTRIRPSRLGVVDREATFKELLSGQATLKKSKPQILLFEDVEISKFPKSLKSVANKLKSGKPLTYLETTKLLRWQQKATGKFKPLGFITRESEITLAPNEVIKRIKKVGVTIVNGKRVPIISTKVVKIPESIKSLVKKARSGKATQKEIKTLQRRLKKETGFDYSSSSLKKTKPYYPLKRKISSKVISSAKKSKGKSPTKRITSRGKVNYTSSGRPYIVTSSGARFVSPTSSRASPTKIKPKTKGGSIYLRGAEGQVQKTTTKPKRFARTKQITKKKKSKPVPVFNVFGKSGKKFVKLNVKPLTKDDALNKGAYAIDRTTSKQFKIVPAGKTKKPSALRKSEHNYFKRSGYKFREYRIKKGRGFLIKPKYIEKTKYGIDTRGEKSGLSIAKYLAQQRRGGAVRKKSRATYSQRKVTPAQRRVLLQRLKKARAVRMKNLRRKK